MEKLKTLKDLKGHMSGGTDCVLTWEVRQEAIKWVKEINKDGGMCHTCDELWMRFFNITEEELK